MDETSASLTLSNGRSVSATWSGPTSPSWTFVYAPGAGSGLRDGFGAFAAQALAEKAIACLRFQFPYVETGRSGPDRPPVLEATWEAAIVAARERPGKLVVGGRSMGGRYASIVVAKGAAVDALALFAYPLHAPGQPERLRDAHLPEIAVPTLFCSGTNDAFGTPEELTTAAEKVPRATIHWLAGADHGFRAPKQMGRTQSAIWREAVDALTGWLV